MDKNRMRDKRKACGKYSAKGQNIVTKKAVLNM